MDNLPQNKLSVIFKLTCHCVEVVDEGNHKDSLGSQQTRNQGDIDPDIEHS